MLHANFMALWLFMADDINDIPVLSTTVPVVQSARNLRVILDSRFTLTAHVAALYRAGYYQLRQLRRLIQSMTAEAVRTIAAAFISCRLDYCNSLLYGLPDTLLRKLQSVQNATAQLITGTRRVITSRRSYANSIGYPIPIPYRVRFKVAYLVHQSLSWQAPLYLTDDCCLVSDSTRRSLLSAYVPNPTCVVLRTLSS